MLMCVINFLTVLYQIGNHGTAAIQASEQQGSVIFFFFFCHGIEQAWVLEGHAARSSPR